MNEKIKNQEYIEMKLKEYEQELLKEAARQTEDYINNLVCDTEFLSEKDIQNEREELKQFFGAEREYLLGEKRKEMEKSI